MKSHKRKRSWTMLRIALYALALLSVLWFVPHLTTSFRSYQSAKETLEHDMRRHKAAQHVAHQSLEERGSMEFLTKGEIREIHLRGLAAPPDTDRVFDPHSIHFVVYGE